MTSTTTKPAADLPDQETSVYLFDDWFDPIEAGVRDRVRGFIETMIRTELDTVLARPRYARQPAANHGSDAGVAGHRHGSRTRSSFSPASRVVRWRSRHGRSDAWRRRRPALCRHHPSAYAL